MNPVCQHCVGSVRELAEMFTVFAGWLARPPCLSY